MSGFVRATLADQAYRELRSRILGGQLQGGDRLLPEELAIEMSISPTPIKEALVRLEVDGLVMSPLRKGAVVRRFSRQDVEELYEARLLVEQNAIRTAMARGAFTPELLASLDRTLTEHERYAGRNTLDDVATALTFDSEFHHQMVLAAGNILIADWHLRVLRQTNTVFVFNAGDYQTSASEHRAVLACLVEGSADRACEALRKHLEHSRANTLANVKT
ncbi:GntR family transcriptional regulator [Alsobacter metallidurans]|uniref:GntR family transcriptional regulator n=1 Tax=Alsobacter metallidurans TaxID=340221 RepID=A0A917MG02_9HYPH|nr:GntR family transcriptional regulator [Alsobacter metallidurans]GGH07243.1 GntR family transcriptional regulator [Alsobacter metallidurans]